MAKRPSFRRSETDIKRGVVGSWIATSAEVELAAQQATYMGSGKHKTYTSKNGKWIIDPKADASKCDKYSDKDYLEIQKTLREAIRAGCTGGIAGEQFPSRVWAYINNVLHEARRTNSGSGEYHAFPLDYEDHYPSDPQRMLKAAPRAKLTVI